jgi:hypothetical protein
MVNRAAFSFTACKRFNFYCIIERWALHWNKGGREENEEKGGQRGRKGEDEERKRGTEERSKGGLKREGKRRSRVMTGCFHLRYMYYAKDKKG